MRCQCLRSLTKACGFLALAGCSGSGEPSGPQPVAVASVSIVAPPTSIQLGGSATLSAQAKDAAGGVVTGKTFTWSSGNVAVATVAADGTVTAVGLGAATITAATDGRSGSAAIDVTPVPAAGVNVTLSAAQIAQGQTAQATAVVVDAAGRTLPGRTVTWTSSQQSIATVDANGRVTAVAPGGPVSIIAATEGVSGSAQLFVAAAVACGGGTLQLAAGDVRLLAGAERSMFCLSGATSSEFVLIPFNSSTVASNMASLQLTASNTSTPSAALSMQQSPADLRLSHPDSRNDRSAEYRFRMRERDDLRPALASMRARSDSKNALAPSRITGIPATPVPGSVYPVNVSVSGNTCTSAKVLRDARVISVSSKVIVMLDTGSPSGGYTDAELAEFGETFNAVGYGVDELNFGTPTDIDANGRVLILFTPSVNALSGPTGGIIGGLQAARDLFPVSTCVGSNEGEMFYMPVPDPASTINGRYTNKTDVARRVQPTLAHELQHLINAGRRIYVNQASTFEEVWLNEGLSHIAEELVYYHVSGNSPRSNIGLATVQSSQAQVDAINGYQVSNLGRLLTYMRVTETSSPYAQNDNLETRGATWQLLRFVADRRGGAERDAWFSLVNSTQSGLANFQAVFGSMMTNARDWAVTQFVDDTPTPVPATFSHPSWNFRTLLPAINSGVFPLVTRTLLAAPLDLSLAGGGAAYVRFAVGAGTTASVSTTTSGQPLLQSVDLILIRTQ